MKRLHPKQVPEWVRNAVANGCGGEGSIFRLPAVLADAVACALHDTDYTIGGNAWHRFVADCRMLVIWVLRAFSRKTLAYAEGYWLPARLGIAVGSFLVVRAFGWKFWNYGRPRTLTEMEMLAKRRLGKIEVGG